jgi:hypothetical protein
VEIFGIEITPLVLIGGIIALGFLFGNDDEE